jgi:hypothetical protein
VPLLASTTSWTCSCGLPSSRMNRVTRSFQSETSSTADRRGRRTAGGGVKRCRISSGKGPCSFQPVEQYLCLCGDEVLLSHRPQVSPAGEPVVRGHDDHFAHRRAIRLRGNDVPPLRERIRGLPTATSPSAMASSTRTCAWLRIQASLRTQCWVSGPPAKLTGAHCCPPPGGLGAPGRE